MSNDFWYFQHDSKSRNDIKLIRLDAILGEHIGYALFFKTLEIMCEMENGKIAVEDMLIVARGLSIDLEKCKLFFDAAVKLELFVIEDAMIFSPRFSEWIDAKKAIAVKRSESGKLGGRPRKDLVTDCAKTVTMQDSGQDTMQDHIAESGTMIEAKLNPISEESVVKLKADDKAVLPETAVNVKAVFDHWNGKQIKVHREISEPLKQALRKALKKFQAEQICGAIDAYAKRLSDPADFWEYRWTLLEFLTRKNALPVFAELSQNTEQVKAEKAQEAAKTQSCELQKRLDESALVCNLSARLWSDFGSLRELLSHLWEFPTPESKLTYIETMPTRLRAIVTAPDSQPLRVMRQGVNENLANEYEEMKK